MKKFVAIAFLLWGFMGVNLLAQSFKITGKVVDAKTQEAIEMAGVKLMKSDSTYVDGLTTGQGGAFSLTAKGAGTYIVQISFIGYTTKTQNVTLTAQKPAMEIGSIALATNDKLLQ